jgi:hypothetical protein
MEEEEEEESNRNGRFGALSELESRAEICDPDNILTTRPSTQYTTTATAHGADVALIMGLPCLTYIVTTCEPARGQKINGMAPAWTQVQVAQG